MSDAVLRVIVLALFIPLFFAFAVGVWQVFHPSTMVQIIGIVNIAVGSFFSAINYHTLRKINTK